MRGAQSAHGSQRQAPSRLLEMGNALRTVSRNTSMRESTEAANHASGARSLRAAAIRYRSGSGHAARQTQAPPELQNEKQRVNVAGRTSRWSAIGRASRSRAEKPKKQNLPMKEKQRKFAGSTRLPLVGRGHQNIIGKETPTPGLFLGRFQAHPSMRICSG
jgi:hypothetical protein